MIMHSPGGAVCHVTSRHFVVASPKLSVRMVLDAGPADSGRLGPITQPQTTVTHLLLCKGVELAVSVWDMTSMVN